MSQTQVRLPLAAAICSTWLSLAASCTTQSPGRDADGGEGGDAAGGQAGGDAEGGSSGSGAGESGGTRSGGAGGAGAGGSAGAKSGGAGGAGTGGSAGGSGGAGGAAGQATGGAGTGGAAAGGAAGTPPMVSGPGVFFSGRAQTIEKLVAADAAPGYFYGVRKDNPEVVVTPVVVEVSDPALPAGTRYAMLYDAPAGTTNRYNSILGLNWRSNKTGTPEWQFFDGSAFAGFSFYARTGDAAGAWAMDVIEARNIPMSQENKGLCPLPTRPECPGFHGDDLVVRNAWQKFSYKFDDLFVASNPSTLDKSVLARIDFIQATVPAKRVQVWITALKLERAEDL